jgi:hypothetical protein
MNTSNDFCANHCTVALFDEAVGPYWSTDAADAIEGKIKEKQYEARLREALGADVSLAEPAHGNMKEAF